MPSYRDDPSLPGLDAWITRDDREYDDGPDEREPCCPPFTDMCADENGQGHEQCRNCGGRVDCELASRPRVQHTTTPPNLLDEDEVCPF
jgi:hypothetical protein